MRGIGSTRIEEVDAARKYGAEIIIANYVQDSSGIDGILNLIAQGSAGLMNMDCDGLDPPIIPTVKAPAPRGPFYRQGGGVDRGSYCI